MLAQNTTAGEQAHMQRESTKLSAAGRRFILNNYSTDDRLATAARIAIGPSAVFVSAEFVLHVCKLHAA